MPPQFGRPFTLRGAKYFCRPATGAAPPAPVSFRDWIERRRKSGNSINESQPDFETFRAQALREADRQLFLAISNYRRSRDLLTGSSASWSWVTMYYGSFHAASAILGCLGVTVDPGPDGVLIDVDRETPTAQSLYIRQCPRAGPTYRKGSHKIFWDLFYHYLAYFKTTLPGALRSAADPVRRNPTWQIDQRNLVTYDTYAAFEVCTRLKNSFNPSRFPQSLDRDFAEQHSATVTMIDTALWLAHEVGLDTDVLLTFATAGSRRQKLEAAIQRVSSPFPVGSPLFNRHPRDPQRFSIHV